MHLNVVVIQVTEPLLLVLHKHGCLIRKLDDLTLSDIFEVNACLKLGVYVPLFKLFILLADNRVVHDYLVLHAHHALDLAMLGAVVALSFHSVDVLEVHVLFIVGFRPFLSLGYSLVFLEKREQSFPFYLSLQTLLPFLAFLQDMIVDFVNIRDFPLESKTLPHFLGFDWHFSDHIFKSRLEIRCLPRFGNLVDKNRF